VHGADPSHSTVRDVVCALTAEALHAAAAKVNAKMLALGPQSAEQHPRVEPTLASLAKAAEADALHIQPREASM